MDAFAPGLDAVWPRINHQRGNPGPPPETLIDIRKRGSVPFRHPTIGRAAVGQTILYGRPAQLQVTHLANPAAVAFLRGKFRAEEGEHQFRH